MTELKYRNRPASILIEQEIGGLELFLTNRETDRRHNRGDSCDGKPEEQQTWTIFFCHCQVTRRGVTDGWRLPAPCSLTSAAAAAADVKEESNSRPTVWQWHSGDPERRRSKKTQCGGQNFYCATHIQRICTARYMLWPGVRLSATTRCFIETVVVVVVVVVVTFFNHNFANCKATLILEIKNLRNKIQYKPKLIELISGTEDSNVFRFA